jgi:hypothetical protein
LFRKTRTNIGSFHDVLVQQNGYELLAYLLSLMSSNKSSEIQTTQFPLSLWRESDVREEEEKVRKSQKIERKKIERRKERKWKWSLTLWIFRQNYGHEWARGRQSPLNSEWGVVEGQTEIAALLY